jgi:hypothetical protein
MPAEDESKIETLIELLLHPTGEILYWLANLGVLFLFGFLL